MSQTYFVTSFSLGSFRKYFVCANNFLLCTPFKYIYITRCGGSIWKFWVPKNCRTLRWGANFQTIIKWSWGDVSSHKRLLSYFKSYGMGAGDFTNALCSTPLETWNATNVQLLACNWKHSKKLKFLILNVVRNWKWWTQLLTKSYELSKKNGLHQ